MDHGFHVENPYRSTDAADVVLASFSAEDSAQEINRHDSAHSCRGNRGIPKRGLLRKAQLPLPVQSKSKVLRAALFFGKTQQGTGCSAIFLNALCTWGLL